MFPFLTSNSGPAGEVDSKELLSEPECEGGLQGLRQGLRVPFPQAHIRRSELRSVPLQLLSVLRSRHFFGEVPEPTPAPTKLGWL